jgi:RES domain-containing protein/HEPN superfamily RES-like protein
MPTDLWCDAEPFMLTRSEQLRFSWDSFCKMIKHKRRHFFSTAESAEDSELFSPSEILRIIFDYAEEAGAFVTLPRGTHLFRARLEKRGERHASALALGPPPLEAAVQTNRMSSPGIVMTYVAEDAETALAETADKPGRFALADFVTERDAVILDLTRLPEAPSIFVELSDSLEYDPRVRLNFLHSISREISKPIARDDRAHIEYVPTQVVTEYVRTAVTIEGQPVAGIRYRSSRRRTETALVLFADQRNLVLEEAERPEFYHLRRDRWLRLSGVVRRKVTAEDIARWAAPAKWTLTP